MLGNERTPPPQTPTIAVVRDGHVYSLAAEDNGIVFYSHNITTGHTLARCDVFDLYCTLVDMHVVRKDKMTHWLKAHLFCPESERFIRLAVLFETDEIRQETTVFSKSIQILRGFMHQMSDEYLHVMEDEETETSLLTIACNGRLYSLLFNSSMQIAAAPHFNFLDVLGVAATPHFRFAAATRQGRQLWAVDDKLTRVANVFDNKWFWSSVALQKGESLPIADRPRLVVSGNLLLCALTPERLFICRVEDNIRDNSRLIWLPVPLPSTVSLFGGLVVHFDGRILVRRHSDGLVSWLRWKATVHLPPSLCDLALGAVASGLPSWMKESAREVHDVEGLVKTLAQIMDSPPPRETATIGDD